MNYLGLLSLLSGLALFLFGMNIMGDGLQKTAGGKLELLLERLSSTPIKGMLLGTIVTAVIQSSSATTVMVVGFVNSGILKLSQAAGIILGANLGTTITAWMLSLADIDAKSSFVSLLKPSSFTPILATIGIILYLFIKDNKKKNIGAIFLGFTVLMYGMQMMSDAVEPLAQLPQFRDMMLRFSNPFLGFLVGTIITAILQSSSASIGILQAFAMTGSVTYGTALPIIMGQNLGTCITALISSIGAHTNGKRAAFIHFYYNVFSELGFMIGFYTLNSFIHFSFLANNISAAGIASVHSIFNICTLIIFMPFVKQLEAMAIRTVKDNEESDIEMQKEISQAKLLLSRLDLRFLEAPAVAVEQCVLAANEMAITTKKAFLNVLELLHSYDEQVFKKVESRETATDIFEDRIGSYIVKLTPLVHDDENTNILSAILHCISNLERIGDHCANLAETSQKMQEKNIVFSEDCKAELEKYLLAVNEIVDMAIESFTMKNLELAKRVEPLEEVIDGINEKARRHHVRRLRAGQCSVESGVHFDDICNDLERISDHCSNIAVCIIQIKENIYDSHEYLDTLKETQSPEFLALYKEYYDIFSI